MFGNFLIISNKEFSRKYHKAVRNLLILAFLICYKLLGFQVGHPPLYVTFSICLSIHLSVCLYFCLSVVHHISGTVHHVIIIFGTRVSNDNISRHLFFFLQNFDLSGYQRVKTAKNGSKMTKNYVRHAPYLRNHTSYDCHFWYTCVK